MHVVMPSVFCLVAIAVTTLWAAGQGSPLWLLLLLGALWLAGAVVLVLSWRKSARYVLSLSGATAEAGVWIMKQAFGNVPDDNPILSEHPWVRDPQDPGGEISRALRDWLDRAGSGGITSPQHAELNDDLAMAREFQHALISAPPPEVPAVHVAGRLRLDFHHRYKPALAVGGDFFQVSAVGNDCAGVFIADVVGHGVRSALLTSVLRALILQLQPIARNASFFLKEMNRHFSDTLSNLPDPLFASAYYFVADTTSRVANYSSAGHPPPILINREMNRISTLPTKAGAALGVFGQQDYPGETVRLIDGNSFIFFTDGVFESRNASGEQFGLARLEKTIQANVYKKTPEILDAILRAIEFFTNGAASEDDICLVAVDITTVPRT